MRVRFYGHIGRLSGYGRAAADLCMSLLATGRIDLEISPVGKVTADEARIALERYAPLRACLRQDHELQTPDVCIVHTLPLDCVKVKEFVTGNGLDPNIPWIAYTTWEGAGLAPVHVRQALVDFQQVWTPSYTNWQTLGAEPRHKIIPHAFEPSELEERRSPRQRGANTYRKPGDPPDFHFYYSGAWTSRKNPAGLLRAWAMAFTPEDKVRLLLHAPGASREAFAVALHQTGLTAQEMAPVHFTNKELTHAEYLGLHRDGDCYVTATRGEAWNLPCFDAVLAGRHVIHPIGMGADDYLHNGLNAESTETSASFYGGMLAPATVDVMVTERMADGVKMSVVGAQGLSSRTVWLEPNLVTLAAIMRDVASERRCDLTVGYDLAQRFSYTAVGNTALSALEEL